MNNLTQELQSEAERREAAFVAKLSRLGFEDLASDYNDIITLRSAIEVMDKKAKGIRRVAAKPTSTRPATPKPSETDTNGHGFVLSDAVRDAIREIKQHRFRASNVNEILYKRYPQHVTEEKRRSIAATLSNLVTNKELSNTKDEQRRVWYTVIKLRDEQPQQTPLQEHAD